MSIFYVLVLIAVVTLFVCFSIMVFIRIMKNHRSRCEWLDGLLNPSVSLEKLIHSLFCISPRDLHNQQLLFYGHKGVGFLVNLKAVRHYFSESLMWRLVDVFVRNAEKHFAVLMYSERSYYEVKNGQDLITALYSQLSKMYGYRSRESINKSPLSDEAKKKLLC